MDWTGGYSCEWRVSYVDPDTWADAGRVPGVTSVSVDRDGGGDAPLIETGSMEVDGEFGQTERWCRISMVAEQGGRVREDVATLLFCATKAKASHGSTTSTADGWSVLKPCADVSMPRGAFAPKGCDGAAWAADLLSRHTPAPVTAEGSFTLDEHYVFDLGATVLEAAWQVVRAGGFRIQIHGDGTVHVVPLPTEPALDLDLAHAALLVPGVEDELDTSGVPNRVLAYDGAETGVATNEDAASPVSYTSRGRWVDLVETNPARVNGESLDAFASRRLAEESAVARRRTYTREWWPGVMPYSLVRGSLPSVGLDGDMRVVSQGLSCGAGVTVTETAEQEVRLWG